MTGELASEVRRRAGDRCEYCSLPQSAFRRPFHIENIIAKQHGGQAQIDNLAFACWYCNFKKGPNLAGIDPDSREVALLFDPRRDRWLDHFMTVTTVTHPPGIQLKGLTPTGRATVSLLGMNETMRCILRYELSREGKISL